MNGFTPPAFNGDGSAAVPGAPSGGVTSDPTPGAPGPATPGLAPGLPATEAAPIGAPLEPTVPAMEPAAGAPAAPVALPGVVVVDPAGARCAALCQTVLEVAGQPDADDWALENAADCVIPGTLTAISNQACTTLSPLPAPELLPGVLVGDGLGSACTPLCVVLTAPTTLDAPDWAFERNASCVLPGSVTATSAVRTCTFGAPEGEPLIPPALTGPKVAPGFFVENGRLLDPYGEDFVIRGVNSPHIWFDTSARYSAYLELDRIASFGTNTIRVAWDTTGPVSLLREVLHRVVELEMVPIVELHDVTGRTSRAELLDMAEYYASTEMRQLMLDYREYALINIANEWSGNDYFGAYQEAVNYLRNNGLTHTLVIDANGFGQNGQTILNNAAALSAADPERNLLFSVHMYELFGTANAVDAVLNGAEAGNVPLIVGEFGPVHNGRVVAWERILTRTNELGMGFIPWSWFGNDASTAQLDMVAGPNGPLTAWGQDVMTRAPGNIQDTSRRASIFE